MMESNLSDGLTCTAGMGKGDKDITFAVIVLGTALLAGMAHLWRRQILLFLEQHALMEEARLIVNCVEAAFGRGQGKEKWEAAMAKMAEHGWNIDREEVRESLQAAWEILNISQIDAGMKEPGERIGQDVMEPTI